MEEINNTIDAKKEIGRLFLESIWNKVPEEIYDNLGQQRTGMFVLHNVVSLESESTIPSVVIRSITTPFWSSVINMVNTKLEDGRNKFRVCATGTPGIGKTTVTFVLLRMLLQDHRKTVVYLIRTEHGDGYGYEFVPSLVENSDSIPQVYVYEEKMIPKIKSLQSTDTYYVVDPGMATTSCNPSLTFKAKVIIVASPDEKYWGYNQFSKSKYFISGCFKYMPVWDVDELIHAAPFLKRPTIDDELVRLINDDPVLLREEIENRYRLFGGVPQAIFESKSFRDTFLVAIENGINSLNVEQAKNMFYNQVDDTVTFKSDQPSSKLIHFRNPDNHNFFSSTVTCLASDLVYDKIVFKFVSYIWNTLKDDDSGKVLESYLRFLLCQPDKLASFTSRDCVGKKRMRARRGRETVIRLGGCQEIRIATDLIASAISSPKVLYYSSNPRHALFDFCYCDDDDDDDGNVEKHLHVFQVTMGKSHSSNTSLMRDLKVKAAHSNATKLSFYYAVLDDKFAEFSTNPVEPLTSIDDDSLSNTTPLLFEIKCIRIVNPEAEWRGKIKT
jgi:hypothetical protein